MSNEIVPKDGASGHDEWMDRFLDNQKRDLELKAQELRIQEKRDANNLEWSKESLAVQARDRVHERECARKRHIDRYYLITALALLFAGLVGAAMYFNKDAIAQEIVKTIALLVVGAFGGYGFGKTQSKNSAPADPDRPVDSQ